MNSQQFSENEPALIERMTADEAREVIDLWMARRDPSALSDSPSVPDVAEGLDITPHEAQVLLAEVRQRKAAKAEAKRQEIEQENARLLTDELLRRQDENTQVLLQEIRAARDVGGSGSTDDDNRLAVLEAKEASRIRAGLAEQKANRTIRGYWLMLFLILCLFVLAPKIIAILIGAPQ